MNLNRPINLTFSDSLNQQFTFDRLNKFVDFLRSEHKYLQAAKERGMPNGQKLSGHLAVSDEFKNIINTVNSLNKLDEWDDNTLRRQINNSVQPLLNNLRSRWIASDHPFADQFVEILTEKGNSTAQGFLDYLTKSTTQNVTNREYFDGAVLAYEYVYQNSDLVKRRHTERGTITRLRDRLLEKNQQLVQQLDDNQQAFDDWFSESQTNISNWYNRSATNSTRRFKAVKKLAQKGRDELRAEFEQEMTAWRERVGELEQTYEEKLRLKKPAQYWKAAAKRYGIQGLCFIGLTALLVITAIMFGLHLFEIWLLGGESLFSVRSVQGAVLFATLAALFGFTLRATTRLAFSSFHLMRDAEEREQLTYLYLSLINESAIDKDSRDIVLQALFSRSETGLLVNESGPTMPGVGDALKAMSRAK